MPAPIDDYLARLRQALQRHGCEDARLIEEAREHLADGIDEGLRRGLTPEDAEREAFERFGPPEVIARSTVEERRSMRNWLSAVAGTLWRWKWWLIAPTLMAAAASSAISHYFLPTRYRSETVIQVQSPGDTFTGAARSTGTHEQFERIAQNALSRAKLERLIQDVGLYRDERAREPLGDVVRRMRQDIGVTVLGGDSDPSTDDGGTFLVSYESPDPRLAMLTAARLAGMLVEQNLRERQAGLDATGQVLEAQVGDMRQRLVTQEAQLTQARASGHSVPEADALAYEVLRDMYKTLLVRREEARSVASFEPRYSGLRFQVTEAARLPDRPVGPSPLGVNTAGTLAGFGLGLLFVAMRGRATAPIMNR